MRLGAKTVARHSLRWIWLPSMLRRRRVWFCLQDRGTTLLSHCGSIIFPSVGLLVQARARGRYLHPSLGDMGRKQFCYSIIRASVRIFSQREVRFRIRVHLGFRARACLHQRRFGSVYGRRDCSGMPERSRLRLFRHGRTAQYPQQKALAFEGYGGGGRPQPICDGDGAAPLEKRMIHASLFESTKKERSGMQGV